MHLKTSTAKWRPFGLGLNVLNFIEDFTNIFEQTYELSVHLHIQI